MNKVQQEFQANEERYAAKVKELNHQHEEKIEQMRLTLQYKNKS